MALFPVPAAARNGLLACALLFPVGPAGATTFHVATTGDDANPGTADQPFRTLARAMNLSSTVCRPGDTVLVRGGIYGTPATVNITKNGLPTARYFLLAAPGERPLLDFSSMVVGGSNRGIVLRGSYWHVRGFDIKGAGDNGMYVSGSNNIIEHCALYENRDTGLQLGGGASSNAVINCDAYWNADPGQGNADGFAPKLDVGTGNSFFGCRAWENSDDGWDGYLRGADDVTTTLESCWCFRNGFLKDGSPSVGNGNGYKTGGSDDKTLMHTMVLIRCLAFDNRVKGFDQNNNRGSITIYHGSAYRNGTNYSLGDTLALWAGKVLTVVNSVSLGPYGSLHPAGVQFTNSWLPPFSVVTPGDFLSVDTAGVRGPRKPDGSLPDVSFLFPAAGSQLVDAGTDVGLGFNGAAPDLGAFERPAVTTVRVPASEVPAGTVLLQSYPNPFNMATTIVYAGAGEGPVALDVFDPLGRHVRSLETASSGQGGHTVVWDGTDVHGRACASGVYRVRLKSETVTRSISLALVK